MLEVASQAEYAISLEAEKLARRQLAEIAAESLERASSIGLPIDFTVTSARGVAVHYQGRRAFFRVVALISTSGGYTVCLRRYTSDCGEVGHVKRDGSIEITVSSIPSFLSSPGELYNSHVSDVWNQRFKAVLNGSLKEIVLDEVPLNPRKLIFEELRSRGLYGIVKVYYSPATLDYAAGFVEDGLLPFWVNSISMALSVSERAVARLLSLKSQK